jgi:Protein of unknown function (DUF2970)
MKTQATVTAKLPFRLPQLLRTVASGMFGIRGRKSHEQDISAISPLQIIVTAVIFMAIFVTTIVSIATWIASK